MLPTSLPVRRCDAQDVAVNPSWMLRRLGYGNYLDSFSNIFIITVAGSIVFLSISIRIIVTTVVTVTAMIAFCVLIMVATVIVTGIMGTGLSRFAQHPKP